LFERLPSTPALKPKMSLTSNRKPNSLIGESSPYLLQHAYNPVHWLPFGEAAFQSAKEQNKPLLISIGYSACHWCHVMEHESFEDEQVAALMNEHFINVKIDREERSDVDMVYMQAVQLMTGHGGWPLNCFVTPDGRPFYGGTYFSKNQWMNVLKNLSDLYEHDRQKVEDYANALTDGIRQSEQLVTTPKETSPVGQALLKQCVLRWKSSLDNVEGGPNRAPKFPLPSNYLFLMRYALLQKDRELMKHVELTLTKMACGGIYDQLHGGFCRYSTDMTWKVPHFEKMLYDNAQLAYLYAEAFDHLKNPLYKSTAIGILNFVEKEWFRAEGFFYSAYDADSEGEEGKYYVWSQEELREVLKNDFELFSEYYEINDIGYWEHGNYILMRSPNNAVLLSKNALDQQELDQRIGSCLQKLRTASQKRVKPGLDDKSLTSWNAMMCSAYARAYLSFGEKRHKEIAIASITFLRKTMRQPDGKILRTFKNGVAKIGGFLDDHAFFVEALVNCYLITQDEKLLGGALTMTEKILGDFSNPQSDLLFYTSENADRLIARSTESSDNVIPSSNAQMAHNLFYLGHMFEKPEFIERSKKMLSAVTEELKNYGSGYSHWGNLALYFAWSFKELAIVGKNVDEKLKEIYQAGFTNAILAVSDRPSDLPLLKQRYVEGRTLFYVCENKTCALPVDSAEAAASQLA
jgi:uncharacterized protein YyaL (SSP411 family)